MDFGKKMVGVVMGLLIAGLLIAYLLPVAIEAIIDVDTASWGQESELWSLIPLFLVLVPIIALVGYVWKTL